MRVKRRIRSSTLRDVKGGASYGQNVVIVPPEGQPPVGPPAQIPPWEAGLLRLTGLQVGEIDAGNITTGTLTTTRLSLALIIVQGATWTDNSPGAGSIAWSGATVYYIGNAYPITDNNTALKYIWWSVTTTNTVFQSSNTRPTLTDGEFLIATNTSGAHDLSWNAPSNSGVFPTHMSFEAMASLFIYGDGVDGTVTISADTDLTRDMSYDTLTINSSKILRTNGYRIFVKNTLTNNGTIRHNGSAGGNATSGATSGLGAAGTGAVAGTMGGGGNGGGGGAQNVSPAPSGAALSNGLGAAGGAGGQGEPNVASLSAGSSGTNTTTVANRHGLVLLSTSAEVRGGLGGGGGSAGHYDVSPSDTSQNGAGGGGGGGGGIIIIAARTIVNGSGIIEAKGAAGGNGGSTNVDRSAFGGGGGGGGGGAIVLVYRTLTSQGTLTVTGAAGGLTGRGAASGATGSTGLTLLIQQEA